jgi:hypothetical protein
MTDTTAITDEEGTLDIEALRDLAHREMEIARLMGPSDDLEAGWLRYLEKLVSLTDRWIATANQEDAR